MSENEPAKLVTWKKQEEEEAYESRVAEVTRRANEYKKRLKQEDEDTKAREAEAARFSAQKKQEKI